MLILIDNLHLSIGLILHVNRAMTNIIHGQIFAKRSLTYLVWQSPRGKRVVTQLTATLGCLRLSLKVRTCLLGLLSLGTLTKWVTWRNNPTLTNDWHHSTLTDVRYKVITLPNEVNQLAWTLSSKFHSDLRVIFIYKLFLFRTVAPIPVFNLRTISLNKNVLMSLHIQCR